MTLWEGFELPEGWIEAALNDLVNLNPPKPSKDALHGNTPVSFIPMVAVDAGSGKITGATKRAFGDVRDGYTSFIDGDVIFAKITPCMENGKVAIAHGLTNGLGFGSTEFHVLRPSEAILAKYLFHYVRQESFRRIAESEMTGSVGQRRVPAAFLKGWAIPLPPLAEQRRIVAKVEELLEKASAARERLQRVPEILKRFRQSVLAAACSGRLTEDWREEHPHSTAINLSAQSNSFEPSFEKRIFSALPAGWTHVALGALGAWSSGGTPSKGNQEFWTGGKVPWVTPKDMKSEVIFDSQDHITEAAAATARLKLLPKDSIIFVVRGMILAHSFPVAALGTETTINQDLRAMVPNQLVNPYYLLRALQAESLHILFAVRESTHGTRRLESDALKVWPIALPPLPEQNEIVRRVTALFGYAETIEQRVASATRRAEKLPQAILAKAFRGELVPTEAELARSECRTYEPASVLLKRIKAEIYHQSREW